MVAEIVRQEEFEGTRLAVIEHSGEEWFMAEDIGKALGYAGPRSSIIRIFSENRDEFKKLTCNLNLRWHDGQLDIFRVFNSQACIKFGFFANTPQGRSLRPLGQQLPRPGREASQRGRGPAGSPARGGPGPHPGTTGPHPGTGRGRSLGPLPGLISQRVDDKFQRTTFAFHYVSPRNFMLMYNKIDYLCRRRICRT